MSIETPGRDGLEFICELEPGWVWQIMGDGRIALAHPDHPPEIMQRDGNGGWKRRVMNEFDPGVGISE